MWLGSCGEWVFYLPVFGRMVVVALPCARWAVDLSSWMDSVLLVSFAMHKLSVASCEKK